MTRSVSTFLSILMLSACGGGSQRTTPDESSDLGGTSGGSMSGRVVDMPVGLGGTHWRWVEAHCTEGPLDLASRGFSQTLQIDEDGSALRLTYDATYANDGCAQTVVQRVSPPPTPGELRVEEISRIADPPTEACFGRPEQPRPGEVRRAGNFLEVLVQRSNWCGGFEVRMVYAPTAAAPLEDAQLVRRYATLYGLGDADGIAALFAPTGSFLQPFWTTETGDPYRHDGREAVRQWHREAFSGAPWRAMRILGIARGEDGTSIEAEWEYMDPRLAEPMTGLLRFTIAGGEIFQAEMVLRSTPVTIQTGEGGATAEGGAPTP